MAKHVRRSRVRLLISFVAVAATLSAAARTLALIAGGHGTKTDCYSEFDILDLTGVAPRIQCTDGDPCDQDHKCDDVCTFTIRLCINQHDVSGCTPPTAGLTKIKARPPKLQSLTNGLSGSNLTQAVCGDQQDIVVKVRKGKKNKKPGRQPVRVFAAAKGSKPDIDAINLFCLPRPADSPCPPPPTTTTTLPGAITPTTTH